MSADSTAPLPAHVDLAVIGAGPAGLAAATEAARHGISVAVLDEQAAPGGQIYRAIDANRARGKSLDADYAQGGALTDAFRASGATALLDASVWLVEADGTVGFTRAGAAHLLKASRVIVASGAIERPVPIPGWTTPGVMTVGAAQILLKTAGLVPQGKVWLAGSGPLLRLYAVQALAAGGRIAGIIDTTPRANYRAALPHALGALRAPAYLRKGLAWSRALKRAGVRWLGDASDLRVEADGDGKLAAISFRRGGTQHREAADVLLLHEGVVPNVQITRALGAEHDWDARQRAFKPRLDAWGNTTVESIMVAGDGGGIAGARAAELTGRLAALEAACALGRIDVGTRDAAALPWQIALDRERAIRPFLDALFAPRREILVPADDTLVCRCEEVTARQLREAVALGCLGPNQLKSFTRCGMGPCQGRLCGLTVAEVIAAARGVSPAEIGYYRLRFPIKPLTLGELAALHAPSS
jgi:NADPH-dependent 2,4-dienoyl-CoA reductase/sulfur reductase-like enzyme